MYWFLYEGTPGGKLDVKDDFVIRPDGKNPRWKSPGHRWYPGFAWAQSKRRWGSCS
jgi:hypothetical protein